MDRNIPPALLQQLMAQFGNFQEEAEASPTSPTAPDDAELTAIPPLTDSKLDKDISAFLNPDKAKSEEKSHFDSLSMGYSDIFISSAMQVDDPSSAFVKIGQIYRGKTLDSGICGKKLTFGMVGYSCLDCQMDETCIICQECFENGDHKGHRTQLKQNVGGMCDCGDPDAWKSEGNCVKHNGFIQEDEFMPQDLKDSFVQNFKRMVYYIVRGIELNSQSPRAVKFYSKQFVDLIEFCLEIREEFTTLACLLGKAFYETFEKDFGGAEAPFKLNHSCQDLTGERDKDHEAKHCSCTVMRALLRYSRLLTRNTQTKMNRFFMSLFVDHQFKIHFAIEYLRMINFTIDWEKIGKSENSSRCVSNLTELSIQIMTSEELANIALEKATLKPLLQGMIKTTEKFVSKNGHFYFNETFLDQININIKYTLMKRAGTKRFMEDELSLRLWFQFLEEVNKKKVRMAFTGSPDFSIETNVETLYYYELRTMRHWNEFFSNMVSWEFEHTKDSYFNFFKEAKESILRMEEFDLKNFRGDKQKKNNYARAFSLPLHRLFIQILIGFLYFDVQDGKINVVDLNSERLELMNNHVFEDEKEKRMFWLKMTEALSGSLGFHREVGAYGPVNDRFKWLYYKFGIHSLDVIGLQFCYFHLPTKFHEVAFNSFFQTKVKGDMSGGNFEVAMRKFVGNNKDVRREGLARTYGDFFNYMNEILTNEINITHVIENYIENVDKLFNVYEFGERNPENMDKARIDYLFSVLSARPATETGKFLKFLNYSVEDRAVVAKFMQEYGEINREKRTVMIKREKLEKNIKKIEKVKEKFKKGVKKDGKLPSLKALPYCHILWHNPYTHGEIESELKEKLEFMTKPITKNKEEAFEMHKLMYNECYTDLLKKLRANGMNSKFLIQQLEYLNKILEKPKEEAKEEIGETKKEEITENKEEQEPEKMDEEQVEQATENQAPETDSTPVANGTADQNEVPIDFDDMFESSNGEEEEWEDCDSVQEDVQGYDSEGVVDVITTFKPYLSSLYLNLLIHVENANPKKQEQLENLKELIEQVKIFIQNFTPKLSTDYFFKDFCQKFKVLTNRYSKDDQMDEQEDIDEEEAQRLAEEKRKKREKKLAKRRKKMKSKFSKKKADFITKLKETTDEIMEDLGDEAESDLCCVSDNSVIEKDEAYYILGQMHNSNVRQFLNRKLDLRMGQDSVIGYADQ